MNRRPARRYSSCTVRCSLALGGESGEKGTFYRHGRDRRVTIWGNPGEKNTNLKWVVVPTLPDVPHPGRLSPNKDQKMIMLDEPAVCLSKAGCEILTHRPQVTHAIHKDPEVKGESPPGKKGSRHVGPKQEAPDEEGQYANVHTMLIPTAALWHAGMPALASHWPAGSHCNNFISCFHDLILQHFVSN